MINMMVELQLVLVMLATMVMLLMMTMMCLELKETLQPKPHNPKPYLNPTTQKALNPKTKSPKPQLSQESGSVSQAATLYRVSPRNQR